MFRAWERYVYEMAVLVEDTLPDDVIEVHRRGYKPPQVHESTFGVTSYICCLHQEMLRVLHTSYMLVVQNSTITRVDDDWLHGTMSDKVKNTAQLKE